MFMRCPWINSGVISWHDRQRVDITWKNEPSHFDAKRKQSSRFTFQASAKAIKKGDVVCLLQGALRPTIIRLRNAFSIIIIIAVPLIGDLSKWSTSITNFLTSLFLVWDWDESRRKSQDEEDYGDFISSQGVPNCPMTECRCLDHLDKATRLWNFGLLLNSMERYEEAGKNLQIAVEVCRTGTSLRSVYKSYPGHGTWREADEKALRVIADLLIDDKGAGVEAKYKKYGQTPLSWAAEEGHEAVVKKLLETGAATEVKDKKYGWTPLWYAAANGHEAVVKLLLATGEADVNSEDNNGQTPLSWAIWDGHDEYGHDKYGYDKYGHDKYGYDKYGHVDSKADRMPLSLAAAEGHEAVVKLLLATGKADINSKNYYNQTPLSWTAANGHEAIIKLLVATEKVDINSKNKDGWTPLLWAAANGHEAIIKLLLATKKVDVNSKSEDGRTPLLLAAAKGKEGVVKLLLATRNVDVDTKDNGGRTPLLYASGGGHKAVVRLLLSMGKVDVDAKDSSGQTPLSYAAKKGHEAVVRLLVEKGANLESKDTDGRTLLSCVVRCQTYSSTYPSTNNALQDYQMQLMLLEQQNKKRLMMARQGQDGLGTPVITCPSTCPSTSNALQDYQMQLMLLEQQNKKRLMMARQEQDGLSTPVIFANAQEVIIKLLLEKGADTKSKDRFGRTPLSYAAEEGHEAVVQLLLSMGKVDTDAKDNSGQTPLSYAAEKGHEAVVQLLQIHSSSNISSF